MSGPTVSAVLLCGGNGTRMGAKCPKQFLELSGKPLLLYAFEALTGHPEIGEIIVVYRPENRRETEAILNGSTAPHPPLVWQEGGETRQKSVFNGLSRCRYPVILLHETARPLVTRETVAAVLRHPAEAVTPGADIPFTVLEKNADDEICAVLRRDRLFNVQLPQKFRTDRLLAAHRRAAENGETFTDDSSLYFAAGYACSVMPGDPQNVKVTHPDDLFLAEKILEQRRGKESPSCS